MSSVVLVLSVLLIGTGLAGLMPAALRLRLLQALSRARSLWPPSQAPAQPQPRLDLEALEAEEPGAATVDLGLAPNASALAAAGTTADAEAQAPVELASSDEEAETEDEERDEGPALDDLVALFRETSVRASAPAAVLDAVPPVSAADLLAEARAVRDLLAGR